MSYFDKDYQDRSSGYHGVFERLATTDTQSFRRKKTSPRSSARGGYTYNGSSPSSPHMHSIQSTTSSSSRLVSPKIFDRLANTETYATASMKGKIPNKKRSKSTSRKTSNAFFERMAYTETFASAKMKGLLDTSAKKKSTNRSSSRGRSVASAKSTRSERRGLNFWDRMSKTETYASAKMKGKIESGDYQGRSPTHSTRSAVSATASRRSTRSTSRTGETRTSFFERLSRTETLSSMQKKKRTVSTPDAARRFHTHNSRPSSIYTDLKPIRTKKASPYQNIPSSNYGSPTHGATKYLSKPKQERYRIASPTRSTGSARSFRSSGTNRSVRSTHTAVSARSTRSSVSNRSETRSTATTRSVTTARSAAASLKSTRSGTTLKSSRSSNAAQSVRRSPERTTASRRLPPPSPTTRRSSPKPSVRSNVYGTQSTKSTNSIIKKRVVEPKPEPPRKPEPRPVLQFDDDDELSFGSEETDEASLGPASTKAAPQDVGSVASKRSTSSTPKPVEVVETEAVDFSVGGHGPEFVSQNSLEVEQKEEFLSEMEVIDAEPEDTPPVEFEEEDILREEDSPEVADEIKEVPNAHASNNAKIEEEEYVSEVREEIEDKPTEESDPVLEPLDESDDDFSFGSEDEDDENWLGSEKKEAQENEPIEDQQQEHYDDESLHEDQDELGDLLGSPDSEISEPSPEPTKIALVETVAQTEENVIDSTSDSVDEVMSDIEEGEEDSLEEEGDKDMENEHNEDRDNDGEDEDGIEVVKTQTDSQEYEELDDDNDMEYGDEDEDDVVEDEADIPNEEAIDDYDEEEDIEQIDSLDLILDMTKSNESDAVSTEQPQQFEDELEEEEEDEFTADQDDHIADQDDHHIEDHAEEPVEDPAEESQSRYIILKSEKYHPEYGFEELLPENLYLTETLQAFEEGEISNEEFAVLLIEAMFERDFDNGDHWEIDPGTARELEEDEGGGGDLEDRAFVVKRQARLDWNDLYSVAAAKGTIIIDPEKNELRIEDYSYFVAG